MRSDFYRKPTKIVIFNYIMVYGHQINHSPKVFPESFSSERGIRMSEVRFVIGTQIFSLFHARDKTENIFLYCFTELKLTISLILFILL